MRNSSFGNALIAMSLVLSSCSADRPGEHAAGKSKARVLSLCAALDAHREDKGELPDAALGLNVFLLEPEREGAITAFNDGWRRPVRPMVSGTKMIGVYSLGPNGLDEKGLGDDVACAVTMR